MTIVHAYGSRMQEVPTTDAEVFYCTARKPWMDSVDESISNGLGPNDPVVVYHLEPIPVMVTDSDELHRFCKWCGCLG